MELPKREWLAGDICVGVDGSEVKSYAEDGMSRNNVAVDSEVSYEWNSCGGKACVVASCAFGKWSEVACGLVGRGGKFVHVADVHNAPLAELGG